MFSELMETEAKTPTARPSINTAEYKQVRGLTRGLAILRAMNACEGGRVTSLELAKLTTLHRTTVRRLLETLIDEGFVRRSESDDSYRLLIKVRELSEGFTDAEWVSSIVRPVMVALLAKVVWPSDLTTANGDAMIVRESTHRFSALSFQRSMVGRRLPMLMTASGRAFFAYSSPDQQESILQLVRGGTDEQSVLAQDPRFIRNLVDKVRSEGCGTNHAEWSIERKTGSIAMPILLDGQPIGCMNVIYLARAVTTAQAIAKFAAPLRAAVTQISELMQAKGL